ncbi:dTDP-4-dehydrorhamnose 3,5-epimerase [Luoshenia tenuis]|jgi:dTDP-4-dehydrorhamnose 3,5-epimerase|uniref:dTDP-4-dehydrorhamnose 3,5-epimerase n=1 Tax=Luoshenia tenuis TaxID=2763654 RepID=UPI003D8B820C
MAFEFEHLDIPGLVVVHPQVFGDARGYFEETFREDVFAQHGIKGLCQDNESKSTTKGVLRGLHFQTQHTQAKLVRCIIGAVYDVAVDLRRGSPTYGQWRGVELTAENHTMFYVPEGFAHGFMVTSDEAVFAYKCSDYYAPEYEGGILWNDPDIGVKWPLDIAPMLSPKDQVLPRLRQIKDELPFIYQG